MSLVKQINGKWYKQLTCNKLPVLVEWNPTSEMKAYNRAFNRIPNKDRSKSLSAQGFEFWRNRAGFITMVSR